MVGCLYEACFGVSVPTVFPWVPLVVGRCRHGSFVSESVLISWRPCVTLRCTEVPLYSILVRCVLFVLGLAVLRQSHSCCGMCVRAQTRWCWTADFAGCLSSVDTNGVPSLFLSSVRGWSGGRVWDGNTQCGVNNRPSLWMVEGLLVCPCGTCHCPCVSFFSGALVCVTACACQCLSIGTSLERFSWCPVFAVRQN